VSPPRSGSDRSIYDLVTEAEFQDAVVSRATLYRWWVWHDNDARRNHAGLPDLILVRPPRVIFAELKREREKPTKVQAGVLAMLGRCPGVEVYVWRPSDERTLDAVLRRE
jgi:hypothetical protein